MHQVPSKLHPAFPFYNQLYHLTVTKSLFDGLFFFFCRVSEKTVHIVVENNITFLIVLVRPADSSSILRQGSGGFADLSRLHAKSGRNGSR